MKLFGPGFYINAFDEVSTFDGNRKERFYRYFLLVWNFILSNEEKCRCYMRYCYSVYFKNDSEKYHSENFENIVNNIAPYFKSEVSLSAVMHSVFAILLDFAVQVYNGQVENDENMKSQIFQTIYTMLSPYFND